MKSVPVHLLQLLQDYFQLILVYLGVWDLTSIPVPQPRTLVCPFHSRTIYRHAFSPLRGR